MSNTESTPTYRSGATSIPADGSSSTPEQRGAALAFLQELAAEVSRGTVDLPCFSNVVVRISEALVDPNTTSEQVVTIVGAEPRLAARLLQTANSAAFNAIGKPVTDLRSAVTRIGQQMVQSIAISYAIKQMQYEDALRSIAQPLNDLWVKSIAAACICQLVAERTKVRTDVAFLAGLLHGIGTLYIMAHVATRSMDIATQRSRMEMLDGWEAPIGKAVLESWGFAEDMCEAVADQRDYARKWQHEAGLTDVLIVSLLLADSLRMPEPREIAVDGINAFASIGLNATDCQATLMRAERRIALVHDALK
ncbi:MAG: HDOD domain-containing protein [Steroidobacteraceae bacterium]|jgi:HD-like signal output (HDOD) protein